MQGNAGNLHAGLYSKTRSLGLLAHIQGPIYYDGIEHVELRVPHIIERL